MAPDQAFPSVSNGFSLEDLTASVNRCVWQGVLLMLSHSLQVPRGLIKGKEPEEICRGCLTTHWQSVVLQLMKQLVSRLGMPRGQRQVRSAQLLTGPQVGVALKSHSQFFF